jgi:hypothetical protein
VNSGILTTTYDRKGAAMPYTEKAERFFQGCRHSPGHMKGKCPDDKFLEKFAKEKHEGMESKEKAEGQKRAARKR